MKTECELTIESVGARGDGIGRQPDGSVVYVPGTLTGERVRAELVSGGHALLKGILSPSSDRVPPPCRYFGTCGGCVLQHMHNATYARFKKDIVLGFLEKAGVTPEQVEGPDISPPGSRRRATFAAQKHGKKLVLGFNERGSLDLVPIQECAVLKTEIVALLPALREVMTLVMKNRQKADITVTFIDGAFDVLITGPLAEKGKLPFDTLQHLTDFCTRAKIDRLSWRADVRDDPELVMQAGSFTVTFGGVKVTPPGGGFLQATDEGEKALVAHVLEAFTRKKVKKKVADLYAGCGTFSLPLLAAGLKVDALEGYGPAVESLKAAAKGKNGFTAAKRDLIKEPLSVKELAAYDAIVLDPPRDGAAPQAKILAKSDVPLIVYVSCSASNFSRDARYLTDGGYKLKKLSIVDQFLWSHHVEMVVVFEK